MTKSLIKNPRLHHMLGLLGTVGEMPSIEFTNTTLADEILDQVLPHYPDISMCGWDTRAGFYRLLPEKSWPEKAKQIMGHFNNQRARFHEDFSKGEIQRAIKWLAKQRKTKQVNRNFGTSYRMKHVAEATEGKYISNGALILSALALKFQVKPVDQGSPNCWINVAKPNHKIQQAIRYYI